MRRETGMTALELSKLANLYKIPASLLFSIEVTECFPSDIIAPSFWTVLAERRAFVTKGCTTTSACQMTSSVISERCSRSKTRDWICSYCCNSDRCNYYVPVSYFTSYHIKYPFKKAIILVRQVSGLKIM